MSNSKNTIILCSDIFKMGHLPTHFGFRFERNGFDVQYLPYPMAKKGISVEKIAEMNLNFVQELRAKSKHSVFIGHGIGGRIGMELLCQDPLAFDAVVTIATSYKASSAIVSVSDIGPLEGILEAFSPLLLELRKDANIPEQLLIPSLSLAAQFDSILGRDATADIIDEHTTIPLTTHSSILSSGRAYLEVLGWLNYAVFSPHSFGGKDIDDVVVK